MKCTGHTRNGQPCKRGARTGATVCPAHGGNAPQVRQSALVRAEIINWGLGDTHVDPGEILLRLVSQSAARAELYGRLLAEAYEAAERMKAAHKAGDLLIEAVDDEEDEETQRARADLTRIFNTGGVSALIGSTYASSERGGLYATGEQIRGLAELEAKERDRCANFAAKAVAAGLAKRQVELAERQGQMILTILTGVFDELGLSDRQLEIAPAVIRRHLELMTG